MFATDKKDLEDTVRNLREENAKLLQLLRSQGLILDTSINQNGKSSDVTSDTTNITFDHSDLTLTTNSINTTNQIHHQHINNHETTNQQNYNEQTVHGNQSNITPNFNTVIQSTAQPFVQNNSNTLVQNNTNLIQPINLVNINNVSLDSIQSFFASQNNLVYLSQTSSTTTTTTTTTTTSANSNINDSLTNTHSILPPPSLPSQPPPPPPSSSTTTSSSSSSSSSNASSSTEQHRINIRPKPSLIHPHQELVPVIPKIKTDLYESITRQYSSSSTTSNNDTSNLLDNDSNDGKQKYPRPIRPKPSSRTHSLQTYKSVVVNESRPSSSFMNNSNDNSPTISLFSSPTYSSSSSTTNFLSQSSITTAPTSRDHSNDHHHHPPLLHSKSLDLSSSSTTSNFLSSNNLPTANKKSNKTRLRNRKKASTSSVVIPSTNNSTLVPIAPNIGRPLAPAPLNAQRIVTSNNPITKRSTTNRKPTKRNNTKTLVQYHSETVLQQNPSSLSPTNSFADSISGLLQNFDPELIASDFLSQSTTTTTTTMTGNLLNNEDNNLTNANIIQNIDHGAIQNQESYNSTAASMPTLEEFHDRLENETTIINNQTTQDFNVENEQITSFMSEEDMRLVEMNFDENTFLKQFDLDDAGIRLSVHSDQNLFANILTNNNELMQIQQQQPPINESITTQQNPSLPLPSLPPVYPGSSLINNNVFTTVVPLGLQHQTSQTNAFINNNTNTTSLLPEEGVQLTARHIEPSQVATYESVKYQDILDDLVMVTDQEALRHAQAAAGDDPAVVSTDFSFALLEATDEIIKNTHIEIVDGNCSTFTELQYLIPIEQEQEILQKQLESCSNEQQQQQQQIILNEQRPIVVLEKLPPETLPSPNLNNENVHDDTVINPAITDLSSLLEFQSVHSPIQHDKSTTDLITPIRSTKTIASTITISKSPQHHLDLDSLLPSASSPPSTTTTATFKLTNIYDNNSTISYSPISDTLALSSNSLRQELRSTETTASSKPSILFEPISSSSNPPSPIKSSENEMIVDSGCLEDLNHDKTNLIAPNDNIIEELLGDATTTTTTNPYEIIENQGQTLIKNDIVIDDVDELIEQIETSTDTNPKRNQLLEQTFSRYQEIYHLNLQREENLSLQKSQEQLLTIPPVKLKLNSIYSQISLKNKEDDRSRSPSPISLSQPIKQSMDDNDDDQPPPPPPVERPSLKIKIRTKLPLPPPSPPPTTTVPPTVSSSRRRELSKSPSIKKSSKKKKHKVTKKKSHSSRHHDHQQPQKKVKTSTNHIDTEYAGLTRFEQPLAQLYRQQSPPTPDEIILKDENHMSPMEPSTQTSTTLHSGFIIDEQTPPSSITSNELKQSPPPLLINQTTTENDKLKLNYSHVFDYANSYNSNTNNSQHHHEHQNNNTFITPPPEIDLNLQQHHQQQKSNSYDNFCQFSSTSPNKKKHHHRKSSVTSCSSNKSLSNTDYAIDTQELEPVSPTPISKSKQKHSQHHSSSSSSSITTTAPPVNYNDIPSSYFDHQQQKQMKEHHSRRSSASSSTSSNRSLKQPSTQCYQQSRSLSNHTYRTAQDPSLVSPILPPPPPPIHLDPYAQSYHHPYAPGAAPPPPPPYFNFPFPHPFLNPHATAASAHYPPPHHHPHSMKYSHPHSYHPQSHHHHHHSYPTHQQQYSYHPHLPRQQQYNNSNYMSSRDHHSFDR